MSCDHMGGYQHCGKAWPHKEHSWPWPENAPWADWKQCPGSEEAGPRPVPKCERCP